MNPVMKVVGLITLLVLVVGGVIVAEMRMGPKEVPKTASTTPYVCPSGINKGQATRYTQAEIDARPYEANFVCP